MFLSTDMPQPDGALVNAQLERLKRSPAFSRSNRLFAFLRFVVEETLAERGETLKELVIGDALYGHHAPYDPRIESTVRVEARRLRRKLSEHYETNGVNDPVRIELPVGSYRPSFRRKQPRHWPLAADDGITRASPFLNLAIMPFRALSGEGKCERFADGLTDELIYALTCCAELRLAPRLSVFQYKGRCYQLADAARTLGASMLLHGTLRCDGERYRITMELADPQGFVVWSERFHACCDDRFLSQEEVSEKIAARIVATLVDGRAALEPARQLHALAGPSGGIGLDGAPVGPSTRDSLRSSLMTGNRRGSGPGQDGDHVGEHDTAREITVENVSSLLASKKTKCTG